MEGMLLPEGQKFFREKMKNSRREEEGIKAIMGILSSLSYSLFKNNNNNNKSKLISTTQLQLNIYTYIHTFYNLYTHMYVYVYIYK